MLKLQYDETTGVVGKAYPEAYDVATPYIEIDEATNDKIAADAENIYFVVNNELTTTPTDGYKNKTRLAEIDKELTQADVTYQTVLNTPVKYTNGYTYLPSYVDSYALLIASGVSPLTIWDSTELNSVSMTTAELTALSTFLKDIAEPAFQTRKTTRKALLTEKATLITT